MFACRTTEAAVRLKPHPLLVQRAIALLRVRAEDCVFVGDSVSGVQPGLAAGMRVLGLAKTPERGWKLLAAGAPAIG
ncbi:MAG: HAD-IA family hydrolase [Actinomycetia bacterium]|nr:HAD-IA family hydrolase [Actinomycetes bacterium]